MDIDRAKKREFLPKDIRLDRFETIQPFFDKLLEEQPAGEEEIRAWLKKRSEVEAFASEEFAWAYINFTRNTRDKEAKKRYEFLITEIQPKISPYDDKLNRHLLEFKGLEYLEEKQAYHILIKSIRNSVELYREKNIPLFVELNKLSQQFSEESGAMTIHHDGKEMTLQQASVYLELPDRKTRQVVFDKIIDRRLQSGAKLDGMFSYMLELRQKRESE